LAGFDNSLFWHYRGQRRRTNIAMKPLDEIMKTTLLSLLPLLLATPVRALDAVPQDAPVADAPSFAIAERGPNHRIWTNSAGGTYEELATGMNFIDQTGNWAESSEEIQILNGYGVAQQGQHQVVISPNVNQAPATDLLVPDGLTRFQTHILGIAYFDASSGKSLMIAVTKDAIGQLVAPNIVLYPDSFTDLRADVRVVYTRYGFEQDIILRAQPPPPQNFGLDPNSSILQVWTEFLNPPVPQQTALILYQENDPQVRQAMAQPDLIDHALDFGSMTIGQGTAFTIGDNPQNPLTPDESTPICKEWNTIENRTFLTESVPYLALKPMLDTLPAVVAAIGKPSKNPRTAALKNSRRPVPRGERMESLMQP